MFQFVLFLFSGFVCTCDFHPWVWFYSLIQIPFGDWWTEIHYVVFAGQSRILRDGKMTLNGPSHLVSHKNDFYSQQWLQIRIREWDNQTRWCHRLILFVRFIFSWEMAFQCKTVVYRLWYPYLDLSRLIVIHHQAATLPQTVSHSFGSKEAGRRGEHVRTGLCCCTCLGLLLSSFPVASPSS